MQWTAGLKLRAGLEPGDMGFLIGGNRLADGVDIDRGRGSHRRRFGFLLLPFLGAGVFARPNTREKEPGIDAGLLQARLWICSESLEPKLALDPGHDDECLDALVRDPEAEPICLAVPKVFPLALVGRGFVLEPEICKLFPFGLRRHGGFPPG